MMGSYRVQSNIYRTHFVTTNVFHLFSGHLKLVLKYKTWCNFFLQLVFSANLFSIESYFVLPSEVYLSGHKIARKKALIRFRSIHPISVFDQTKSFATKFFSILKKNFFSPSSLKKMFELIIFESNKTSQHTHTNRLIKIMISFILSWLIESTGCGTTVVCLQFMFEVEHQQGLSTTQSSPKKHENEKKGKSC